MKAVFYQSIGPELARYDIDVDGAALIRRDSVTTPGTNVQYVWPHPSKRFLYVVSSDGGPGTIPGTRHVATAFRIDPASGALAPHGDPHRCRRGRCIAASTVGRVSAHRLQLSEQHYGPSHQGGRHARRTGPAARKTRRRNFCASGPDHTGQPDGDHGDARQQPESNKPEDPGALKVYAFKDGVLSNLASIQRGNGLGFGPRHFDIHPSQPWLFLSVERQSELHVYKLNSDGTLPRDAMFIKNALADRTNHMPTQMAGAIHIHPNGAMSP